MQAIFVRYECSNDPNKLLTNKIYSRIFYVEFIRNSAAALEAAMATVGDRYRARPAVAFKLRAVLAQPQHGPSPRQSLSLSTTTATVTPHRSSRHTFRHTFPKSSPCTCSLPSSSSICYLPMQHPPRLIMTVHHTIHELRVQFIMIASLSKQIK